MLFLTQRLVDTTPHADTSVRTTTLDLDTRMKSRARILLNDGEEAGLHLERGLLLRGGDLLANEDGTEIIQVIAADETVSAVYTDDPLAFATACYHLGNRHVPLEIGRGRLAYHHDHVLDDMVRGLGLTVTTEDAPFEPVSGAYAQGHHSHGHGHSH